MHFERVGFTLPKIDDLGPYRLYSYKKQLLDVENYLITENGSVYVCGSLFYKSHSYKGSLKELLFDFLNDDIQEDQLWGNYIIIFSNPDDSYITLMSDPALIKNVYIDKARGIISSHLLAIRSSGNQNYTINENALVENIVTGQLISPDTYFKEIERLDKINYIEITKNFPGIKVHSKENNFNIEFESKKQAVDHANQNLINYFNSSTNICHEYGAHIGLTGGLDSRLILMHARRNIVRLSTNSFWRENSLEYTNAKKLADYAHTNFISFENEPFQMPEMNEQLKTAYCFFDGQFRTQNYWSEEFNNPRYSEKLANNHFVGFHGCGGEQYRNADLFSGKLSLDSFIKYEWIYKYCSKPFKDINSDEVIFQNIKSKIKRLIDDNNESVDLLVLKKIQNEVWNTSNRSTRLNIQNQLMFYFAPFTEANISIPAYHYVPFLGNSMDFQLKMMQEIDPELCEVESNYGFKLSEGEPAKKKVLNTVAALLPRRMLLKIKQLFKKNNEKELDTMVQKKDFENIDFLRPIDYNNISKSTELSKNLFSFLYSYQKIKSP